jgi:hypothetical protein
MNRYYLKMMSAYFVFSSAMTAMAHPNQALTCQQTISGTPFMRIEVTLDRQGVPEGVKIDQAGQIYRPHFEITPCAPNERFHLILDADRPGQELEFIVYQPVNGVTKSELINNHSPYMKKSPGTCP